MREKPIGNTVVSWPRQFRVALPGAPYKSYPRTGSPRHLLREPDRPFQRSANLAPVGAERCGYPVEQGALLTTTCDDLAASQQGKTDRKRATCPFSESPPPRRPTNQENKIRRNFPKPVHPPRAPTRATPCDEASSQAVQHHRSPGCCKRRRPSSAVGQATRSRRASSDWISSAMLNRERPAALDAPLSKRVGSRELTSNSPQHEKEKPDPCDVSTPFLSA